MVQYFAGVYIVHIFNTYMIELTVNGYAVLCHSFASTQVKLKLTFFTTLFVKLLMKFLPQLLLLSHETGLGKFSAVHLHWICKFSSFQQCMMS